RPSDLPTAGNGLPSRVCASTSCASQPATVRSRNSENALTWLAAVRDSATSANASTTRPISVSSSVKPRGELARIDRPELDVASGFAVEAIGHAQIRQPEFEAERRHFARRETHELRLLRIVRIHFEQTAVAAQRGARGGEPRARAQIADAERNPVVVVE